MKWSIYCTVGGALRFQRPSSRPEAASKCEHSQRSMLEHTEDPVLQDGLMPSKCILDFKDVFSLVFTRRVTIVIDSVSTVDI